MRVLNTTLASRRDFLRGCARYPLLAGLAVLGGVLVGRRKDPAASTLCVQDRVCGGCRLFAKCELPPARVARAARPAS